MTCPQRRQRGQVFILSLVVLVALSFMGLALLQIADASYQREHVLCRTSQAAWRVHGGINYACWQLYSTDAGSDNAGLSKPNPAYDFGTMGATLAYPLSGANAADASTVSLMVTTGETDTSLRWIRGETRVMGKESVARALTDVKRPPPCLSMALLTEGDIRISGDATVTSHNVAANPINADVHTNSSLTITGQGQVCGFASASGDANVKEGSVAPAVNPDNLDPYFQGVDPIDIPDIDPASFASDAVVHERVPGATIIRIPGGVSIANDTVLNFGGTSDHPVVVYIDGDLNMAAHTQIHGHVLFVVNGDVHLASHAVVDGDPGSFSFITNNMHLAAWTEVHAMVYLREHLHLTGQSSVYGSVVSKGHSSSGDPGLEMLTGQFDLYYEPTDESVFPEPGKPAILSYQSRTGGDTW
jgi:hypothetical protein